MESIELNRTKSGLYPLICNCWNALSIPLSALHLKFARTSVLKRIQLGKI
ncbi:hypothetical protein RchiOBHm_Chr4g0401171 [Rosa chinensis]|uniref:Uncharacterized protein n=1 Tax=Rosa chinensis TaxID=74649 RepID=A0A2P6QT07_ROSCH|nr:hypothetical protein RchiOBHm_Chr4g0401171 [Rosa chinensis]